MSWSRPRLRRANGPMRPIRILPSARRCAWPMARIYVGCNVENASYGLTICAERNAVAHAVASGARDFVALAVVTENGVTPCGACRQVLVEFGPEMTVIVADTRGNCRVYWLGELLPDAFGPEQLKDG